MSDNIIAVTDETFEELVLNESKPVVLDFWAEWCGPCRALATIFEQVAAEHSEKVVFAKLNIDDNPQTPSKYGVMSIPTLILFKNGHVEETKMGLLTKPQLIAFLESEI